MFKQIKHLYSDLDMHTCIQHKNTDTNIKEGNTVEIMLDIICTGGVRNLGPMTENDSEPP